MPCDDDGDHKRRSQMTSTRTFTVEDARRIGSAIGIDWDASPFDVEQYLMGLDVELEHGARDPQTNVTNDDELVTGKIAWAHLKELPDYYTRLAVMEAEAGS
jgi:hypothetical protein